MSNNQGNVDSGWLVSLCSTFIMTWMITNNFRVLPKIVAQKKKINELPVTNDLFTFVTNIASLGKIVDRLAGGIYCMPLEREQFLNNMKSVPFYMYTIKQLCQSNDEDYYLEGKASNSHAMDTTDNETEGLRVNTDSIKQMRSRIESLEAITTNLTRRIKLLEANSSQLNNQSEIQKQLSEIMTDTLEPTPDPSTNNSPTLSTDASPQHAFDLKENTKA